MNELYIKKMVQAILQLEKTLGRFDKTCVDVRFGTLNAVCTHLLNASGERTVREIRANLQVTVGYRVTPRCRGIRVTPRT